MVAAKRDEAEHARDQQLYHLGERVQAPSCMEAPSQARGGLRLLRQHSGVRRGWDGLPPGPCLQRVRGRRQDRKDAVDTFFRSQRSIAELAADWGGPERRGPGEWNPVRRDACVRVRSLGCDGKAALADSEPGGEEGQNPVEIPGDEESG